MTNLLFSTRGILHCAVLIGVYSVIPCQQAPESGIAVSELIPHLKDGDILCRLGDGFWSAHIRDFSPADRRFSHLGIVRIRDGNLSVIHAEAWTKGQDSVNEVPLEEFLYPALAVGVYRASFIEGAVISDTVLEYKGLPFDWNFDLNDESKLYCTELLYVVLKRIAPEITLQTNYITIVGKEVISLDAVSESGIFEEILYIDSRHNREISAPK